MAFVYVKCSGVSVCVYTFIFTYMFIHNMAQGVTTGRHLIRLGLTPACNGSTYEAEAGGLPGPQSKTFVQGNI